MGLAGKCGHPARALHRSIDRVAKGYPADLKQHLPVGFFSFRWGSTIHPWLDGRGLSFETHPGQALDHSFEIEQDGNYRMPDALPRGQEYGIIVGNNHLGYPSTTGT